MTMKNATMPMMIFIAVLLPLPAGAADAGGITVRAAFGSRRLPWDSVHGLSVTGRSVYAVLFDGGSVRLPCVTVADLAGVSQASGGRLPEVAAPRQKFAPSRRSRR